MKQIGVKDSKKLSSKKRKDLAKIIKATCIKYKVLVVSVEEIDQRETNRITMNRLEELKMAEIINELKPDCIFIDAADVNEDRFGKSIEQLLEFIPKKLISKHKADDIYPIVSAASILAKVKRDTIIEELKQKFGEIGSGYPSDPITIKFLKNYIQENKKAPTFARKTWETTHRILNEEVKSKKITDYLK